MKFLIITDIEGASGVSYFDQVRGNTDIKIKEPWMRQLAKEVNAAVEGIYAVYPQATVYVWDGHGSGGLFEEDIKDAVYLREGKPYFDIKNHAAVLFIGQHAMAGTIDAPLRHTYSSKDVEYYKLNGTFIGEFGARALIAGRQGVPTIYLSGDDKACLEAQMFVPEIKTTAVKLGLGVEKVKNLHAEKIEEIIKNDVIFAVKKMDKVKPFNSLQPPYTLEIRYIGERGDRDMHNEPNYTWLDNRTLQIRSTDLADFPI